MEKTLRVAGIRDTWIFAAGGGAFGYEMALSDTI